MFVKTDWPFNNPFVGPFEFTFGATKGWKLRNVITHNNVILANQKTEFLLYRWQRVYAMFNVTCIPAFDGHPTVFQTFFVDTLIVSQFGIIPLKIRQLQDLVPKNLVYYLVKTFWFGIFQHFTNKFHEYIEQPSSMYIICISTR